MNWFDELIKQKSLQSESPVPDDAWENIIKKKRKKRPVLFWWFLIPVVLGAGGYYMYEKNSNGERVIGISKRGTGMPGTNERMSTADNIPVTGKVYTGESIQETDETQQLVSEESIEKNEVRYNLEQNTLTKGNNPKKNAEEIKERLFSSSAEKRKISGKSAISMTGGSVSEEEVDQNAYQFKSRLLNYSVRGTSPGTPSLLLPYLPKTKVQKNHELLVSKSAKKDNINNKGWLLDISLMPVISIRDNHNQVALQRSYTSPGTTTEFTAESYRADADPSIAFTIMLQKKLKNFSISSGIGYSKMTEDLFISGTETTTEMEVVRRLIHGNSGPELILDTVYSHTSGTRNIKATNSFTMVSLPLLLQYDLFSYQGWKLCGVAGLNFLVYGNYDNEINKDGQGQLVEMRSVSTSESQLNILAGIRIARELNSRFGLYVQPTYRMAINDFKLKHGYTSNSLNQAGVGFGVLYKIK